MVVDLLSLRAVGALATRVLFRYFFGFLDYIFERLVFDSAAVTALLA